MSAGDLVFIVAFALCAFIAVTGALGMATTMSMFRSAIFLMASFVGVAGLFILLAADLMGLLQIMMYIGGMLVMALFMVLFMHDPGGAVMAAMPDMMSAVERLFSRGLQQEQEEPQGGGGMGHHHGDQGAQGKEQEEAGEGEKHQEGGHHQGMQHHGGMDQEGMNHEGMDHEGMDHGGMDMSMVTPVRKAAACLAGIIGITLAFLVWLRPSWPVVDVRPDPDSARAVGMLLMEKYMVAFEGAGFLILLGIFGAVFLAHVRHYPDADGRTEPVARTDAPPAIESDLLMPREAAGGANAQAARGQSEAAHHSHGGHA